MLIAEIDLGMIAYAKSAADPVGHYSRPDVVRLMFNARPNPVVMSFDEGMPLALNGGSEPVTEEMAEDVHADA